MKVLIALVFVFNFCFANIGQITALVGNASIDRSGEVILATLGLKIENKDIIKTQKNSKLQIIFTDNTIVTVGKNSALDINDYLYDEKNPKNSKTNFNFFKGSFKTITGQIGKINRERFNLKTKTASIGIRGTFIVGNQEMVACIQGGIRVKNAGVFVDVEANEFTKTEKNKAPTTPRTLTQQNIKNLQDKIEPKEKKKKNDQAPSFKPLAKKPTQIESNLFNKQVDIGELEVENTLTGISEVSKTSNDNENENTISNKIDEIEHSKNTLDFEGKVQGGVSLYGDEPLPILQDETNQVLLHFDVGGGKSNMTGSMKFTAPDVTANTFDYTLSSSTASLKNETFNINAENKTSGNTEAFSVKGTSQYVETVDTVRLEENAGGTVAEISFKANKK